MLRTTPTGFAHNPRFSGVLAGEAGPAKVEPAKDPAVEAFEQGFGEGYAAAREEYERLRAEQEAAQNEIEVAFARFNEESTLALSEKLRQTVLTLCQHAVLPLAIDCDGLVTRIERAVAMLHRAQDERRVLLHPDDLALVRNKLPAGLTAEPDPSVERGGLRIETPDGGIEDGPTQWNRILSEVFDKC